MDPLRAIRGHVGQQLRPFPAEGVEERLHGGLAAALTDPRDLAVSWSVTIIRYLPLPFAPGLLVDADPAQPAEPVSPGCGVRLRPGRRCSPVPPR